jgi:hypothetical protein
MVLIDQQSGVFAFSFRPETERVQSEVVMQLWAPVDYETRAADDVWMPEVIGGLVAVLFVWEFDDFGRERQISLGSVVADSFFSGELDEAAAGLMGVSKFPAVVPDSIRQEIEARQARRTEAIREVETCLIAAQDQKVWLRLFGGQTAAGRLKSLSDEYVTLDRPRRLAPHTEAPLANFIRVQDVAAAKAYSGRIGFGGPSSALGDWLEATEFAEIAPQLWGARCPACSSMRPLWRTGRCYRCLAKEPVQKPSALPA